MHAHAPGRQVSRAAIERVLARADADGLAYVTFAELVPGPPRPAIAIAFDDSDIAAWYGARDLFLAHDARVTFFVTRFHSRSEEELAMLAELHADGHGVEAHGVRHLDTRAYICDHGPQAYIDGEVMPSITRLRDAGYPVTSYAYPYGNNHPTVDDAVLAELQRFRVSPESCPY